MNVKWQNIYLVHGEEVEGLLHETPAVAAEWLRKDPHSNQFIRVEMCFDEIPHRPPVGIKAEACSHEWTCIPTVIAGNGDVLQARFVLVPR